MSGQPMVDGAEGAGAEKAAVGRERGRMRAGNEEMARAGEFGAEGLGRRAPEEEGLWPFTGKFGEDLADKRLPAPAFVAMGVVQGHGQHGVEEKHPLACPSRQIPIGAGLADVGGEFGEDVFQRMFGPLSCGEGKGEARGAARRRIGVLPKDHHSHLIKGTKVKRIKNILWWFSFHVCNKVLSFGRKFDVRKQALIVRPKTPDKVVKGLMKDTSNDTR